MTDVGSQGEFFNGKKWTYKPTAVNGRAADRRLQ